MKRQTTADGERLARRARESATALGLCAVQRLQSLSAPPARTVEAFRDWRLTRDEAVMFARSAMREVLYAEWVTLKLRARCARCERVHLTDADAAVCSRREDE